jgi:hypothetical protein
MPVHGLQGRHKKQAAQIGRHALAMPAGLMAQRTGKQGVIFRQNAATPGSG